MKKVFLAQIIFFSVFVANSQDNISYQKPPAIIEKLILADFNPSVSFNDAGDWMLLMKRSAAPTVEDLGQPEIKVAGLRINPTNFSPSRQANFVSISLKNVVSGKEFPIKGLPTPLKASSISWNRAGNKIAFLQENRGTIDLYVIDVKTTTAIKINKTPLNIAMGNDFQWLDDASLIYQTTIALPTAMPKKPVAPDGPVVQQNLGKTAASRTYQDLIKNKYDESLFKFFAKSQLVINKNGQERKIGQPDFYSSISVSPDKKYLLIDKLTGELSYLVPAGGFASNIQIWDMNGKLLKDLAHIPSSELAPSGFDNVLNAPRSFTWAASMPNTLGWIVPLDSGLMKTKVDYRDAYLSVAAPFNDKPQVVLQTPLRLRSVSFIDKTRALIVQGSFAKQRQIWQLFDHATKELKTLNERSIRDAYNDPGTPFLTRNEYGKYVPLLFEGNKFIMRGQGASAKGDYPFVGTFDINTLKQEKLWQSADPNYEVPVKLLSTNNGIRFVVSRQSNEVAPNYYIVSADGENKALTAFADPQPELRQLRKEKITYKRADGIQLSATVYVAKNYDPQKDGKLPVIIVAYPIEYKSSADAAQVRGSKNTFTLTNYGSFVPFALMGYAVMDNTEFPIVGEGDKYPNDSFIEQLELNAKAAINKIAEMGIGDSSRVAVSGHSYGAFMTANLLAHTNLFKAGIARSGAYNRTLTPFGFQGEDRTYWQAPDIYNKMSPFSYADKIKTPILLIHGEADNNSGTFPIQSERLYNAIKGHGGIVRYVQLPFESHGYAAKENLLHLLWEEYQWLEKYVKGK